MKKQFIILAAAVMPLAFFSCSKEKIEKKETNDSIRTDVPMNSQKQGIGSIGSLSKNLECLFQFNGDLKDAAGKLPDGVPNISGAIMYTDDRKGNLNSAIKFTGRYGVEISNVPYATGKSVAAWVKYESSTTYVSTDYFLKTFDVSVPNMAQEADKYTAVISGDTSISAIQSNPMDGHWHFLVATYDGANMKFYIDGSYVGNSANVSTAIFPSGFTFTYHVGYFPALNDPTYVLSAWVGSMDDLRFYTRILSATEIQKLYNL